MALGRAWAGLPLVASGAEGVFHGRWQRINHRLPAEMQEPPPPPNEEQRLASLRRLGLLDTPAEERFDRITRLARKSLGAPIALVSLVDDGRQWFKSTQGLDETETDRAVSFCGHAILGNELFVVRDASTDPRFSDNPLVVGGPSIRFYAGRPIISPDGFNVGTLCVIDRVPREPTWDDLKALDDLGALVEAELRVDVLSETEKELRQLLSDAERRASIDSLTKLWNREASLRLLHEQIERAARFKHSLAVLLVDLDHFKQVNDEFGHLVGDEVLREVAIRLRVALRSYDTVGRYGGEEFIAVLPGCEVAQASVIAKRIQQQMHAGSVTAGAASLQVTLSIGICARCPERGAAIETYIDAADRALYAAKRAGRDRIEIFTAAMLPK